MDWNCNEPASPLKTILLKQNSFSKIQSTDSVALRKFQSWAVYSSSENRIWKFRLSEIQGLNCIHFEASPISKMPRSFLITNRRYKKVGGCLMEIPVKSSIYIDEELEEVDNGDSLSYASTPTDALSRGEQFVDLIKIFVDLFPIQRIWSVMNLNN